MISPSKATPGWDALADKAKGGLTIYYRQWLIDDDWRVRKWAIQIYPDTPIGFCVYEADTDLELERYIRKVFKEFEVTCTQEDLNMILEIRDILACLEFDSFELSAWENRGYYEPDNPQKKWILKGINHVRT